MKAFTAISILFFVLSGPASADAVNVSPEQFKHYNCGKIADEMTSRNDRANELYYALKEQERIDDIHNAVAFFIAWPLILLTDNKDLLYPREYAWQKEERELLISEWKALKETARRKICNPDLIPAYVLPQSAEKRAGIFVPDIL